MTINDDFGSELRAAREARGWSLRSVATAVGVSPSLLSQVETGKTHPSVSTLYALVSHLGVSIDDLLGHAPRRGDADRQIPSVLTPGGDAVQRGSENPVIEMENGVTWERLAVGGFNLADPLVTTYGPGGSSSLEGRQMRHTGVEYAYIIEGELTLKLDFDTVVLHAGDSLCFDSSRPHLYLNHTSTPAKGLWFVVGGSEGSGALHVSHDERVGDRTMKSAVEVLAAMREIPPG